MVCWPFEERSAKVIRVSARAVAERTQMPASTNPEMEDRDIRSLMMPIVHELVSVATARTVPKPTSMRFRFQLCLELPVRGILKRCFDAFTAFAAWVSGARTIGF